MKLIQWCNWLDISPQNVLVEVPWSLVQVVFCVLPCANFENIVELLECQILGDVSPIEVFHTNDSMMLLTLVSGRKKYAMKNAAKFQQAYHAKAP